MTTSSKMTPEANLKAIIEAQVRGEYTMWKLFLLRESCGMAMDGTWWAKTRQKADGPVSEWINMGFHTLQVLLDPQGLRAAYPGIAGEARMGLVLAAIMQRVKNNQIVTNAHLAAFLILDAWLSSPEGNAEAAIKTAYQLLPHS